MANAHSPAKETLSIWMLRDLLRKVKKKAERRGVTLTDFVLNELTHATKDITLDPEDIRDIEEATRIAKEKRKRRATKSSHTPRPAPRKAKKGSKSRRKKHP
jgi:uncharacterized protein (DUF1778 family)